MGDTIKHSGFYRRVVNHILKNDTTAYMKGLIKLPTAHKISRKTTIATQSVDIVSFGIHIFYDLGSSNLRVVWHLKAVWHVTSETHIEYGCLDAIIRNDVYNL